MTEVTGTDTASTIKTAIQDILKTIDQEREREIITRRFGLFDRKETLEQIGELLGITRERVRQLEKAILIRLKIAAEEGDIPAIRTVERLIVRDLSENGRIGRVNDIAERLSPGKATAIRTHIAFIAELSPRLTTINETDNYHQGISIAENGDEKKIRSNIDTIVKTIKKHGEPVDIETLHGMLTYESPAQVRALASLSKQLASLKDVWGLTKWPTVNPKNIRDKIYVILVGNGKPLHFSEIAKNKRLQAQECYHAGDSQRAHQGQALRAHRPRHLRVAGMGLLARHGVGNYRKRAQRRRRAVAPRRNRQACAQKPPRQRNDDSPQSTEQTGIQTRR